jgi:hypothetical protein
VAKKTAVKKPAVKKIVAKVAAEAPTPAATPRVHPLIVAFVMYHIVTITIYALPKPSDDVLKGKVPPRGSDALLTFNFREMKQWNIFYGYLYPTGFWQYWDMFSPDPAQTDVWCDAEVTFLDGTKTMFQYPRMKTLSIPDKFMQERYRKFYERVNVNDWHYFWPPFAQAIALKTATDPGSPPVRVTLFRHFQEVMRHDEPQPKEPAYGSYAFYIYVVDQKKLFSDKGWKVGVH